MWWRVGTSDRMTEDFPCMDAIFLSSYKFAKETTSDHVTVVWSCNVAWWVEVWDSSPLFEEWRICLAVRLWTPSDRRTTDLHLRLFHSHRHHIASAAALILTPKVDQSCSEHICNLHTDGWRSIGVWLCTERAVRVGLQLETFEIIYAQIYYQGLIVCSCCSFY